METENPLLSGMLHLRRKYLSAFLPSVCRYLSIRKVLAVKRNAKIISLAPNLDKCILDTSQNHILEGRELGQIMNAFLESLPKETRLIFLRRYWHVDTITEIAARYGMTERKIKSQLSRTQKILRTYLESAGISYISKKFIEESENDTIFGKR